MKTPSPLFFPIYSIDSPLVKTAIGSDDRRTIVRRLEKLGCKVKSVEGFKVVSCEDLLKAIHKDDLSNRSVGSYKPKSDISKRLAEFD